MQFLVYMRKAARDRVANGSGKPPPKPPTISLCLCVKNRRTLNPEGAI